MLICFVNIANGVALYLFLYYYKFKDIREENRDKLITEESVHR